MNEALVREVPENVTVVGVEVASIASAVTAVSSTWQAGDTVVLPSVLVQVLAKFTVQLESTPDPAVTRIVLSSP